MLAVGCAGEEGAGPCGLDEALIGDDVLRLQSSAGQTCVQLRVQEEASTRALVTLRVHDGVSASEQTDLTLLGWSQEDQRYWGYVGGLDHFVDVLADGSYELTAYDNDTLVVGSLLLTEVN